MQSCLCFNPRVREGRDAQEEAPCHRLPVSIHASVKDATGDYINTIDELKVSIHASVKDATSAIATCTIGG